jgi:phage gpG-like protein
MATIKIKSRSGLVSELKDKIIWKLSKKKGASRVLVANAKKRIRNSGDSEIKYPELWASRNEVGYRKGGKPLRDTGRLMNSLSNDTRINRDGVEWILLDGVGYGVKHQEGFTNLGPVAVALNRKASRIIPSESPHDPDVLEQQDLRRAPTLKEAKLHPRKYDFYVLQNDTNVPARPIFNTPPEDTVSAVKIISRAIRELGD